MATEIYSGHYIHELKRFKSAVRQNGSTVNLAHRWHTTEGELSKVINSLLSQKEAVMLMMVHGFGCSYINDRSYFGAYFPAQVKWLKENGQIHTLGYSYDHAGYNIETARGNVRNLGNYDAKYQPDDLFEGLHAWGYYFNELTDKNIGNLEKLRLIVVGHSMGGRAVLELAVKNRKGVNVIKGFEDEMKEFFGLDDFSVEIAACAPALKLSDRADLLAILLRPLKMGDNFARRGDSEQGQNWWTDLYEIVTDYPFRGIARRSTEQFKGILGLTDNYGYLDNLPENDPHVLMDHLYYLKNNPITDAGRFSGIAIPHTVLANTHDLLVDNENLKEIFGNKYRVMEGSHTNMLQFPGIVASEIGENLIYPRR